MKFKPSLPILITLVSIVCLIAAIAYNASQMNTQNKKTEASVSTKTKKEMRTSLAPSVVVIEVKAEKYKARVTGYGEALPRYAITYSALVSGRVDKLTANFETGRVVKKGDILAKLENTSYRQALAQAQSALAQAKLELIEEQRTAELAALEWQRSGLSGEPSSPLVLHQPQLLVKIAALKNAEYSLKKAKEDLDKTVIKVPFNALIVDRDIQPGSYLQTGSTIATLYSTDRVEIEIPLSAKQWSNLPKITNKELTQVATKKWPVILYSTDLNKSWQGYVIRIEQHVNPTSRQRSLFIAVDNPFDANIKLFPGTFVQADIDGAVLNNTWKLPASAISQQGDIWFITENNLLNKVAAHKLFEKADSVYVSPIKNLNSAKIVKRPLSNYVVGMLVVPRAEG